MKRSFTSVAFPILEGSLRDADIRKHLVPNVLVGNEINGNKNLTLILANTLDIRTNLIYV